jgi:hypothetical protein
MVECPFAERFYRSRFQSSIKRMKAHFSFGLSVLPVVVTASDIEHGNSRDCTGCAIARALNRTLPRLGFANCHVRLSPYAAWTTPEGLEILQDYGSRFNPLAKLAAKDLPRGLVEWAIDFDEWAEFRDEYGQSLTSWRETYGRDADRPHHPEPTEFIFNFGKLA